MSRRFLRCPLPRSPSSFLSPLFLFLRLQHAALSSGWNTPIPDEDWSSGQLGMCQAFVADLQAERAPLAGGSLGVAVMQVLAAAYRSARAGSTVEL